MLIEFFFNKLVISYRSGMVCCGEFMHLFALSFCIPTSVRTRAHTHGLIYLCLHLNTYYIPDHICAIVGVQNQQTTTLYIPDHRRAIIYS